MAKTLVALYDTCTDAERVVHELITDGFARMRIPRESCHPFHTKVATNSTQNLPLIP